MMAEGSPGDSRLPVSRDNSERENPENSISLTLSKHCDDAQKCATKGGDDKDEVSGSSENRSDGPRREEETMTARESVAVDVTLNKVGGMIGFSISSVYSKRRKWRRVPSNEEHFVQTVVAGGPAAKDGQIEVGDKIIEINGTELYGLPQNQVVSLIKQLDPVNMKLVKKGAKACGVHKVLLQPFVYSRYQQKVNSCESYKNIFGKKGLGMACPVKKKASPVELLSAARLPEPGSSSSKSIQQRTTTK